MLRTSACAAALLLAFCPAAPAADAPIPKRGAAGEAPKEAGLAAVPLFVSGYNPLAADVEYGNKPAAGIGMVVTFMVEGENIVGLRDHNLQMTAATDGDGNDISQTRDGSPACRMGAWPKTAKDGTHVIFEVAVETGKKKKMLGMLDGCTLRGSVVLLTSPGTKKIKKDGLRVGSTFSDGPLTFKVSERDSRTFVSVTGPVKLVSGGLTVTQNGKTATRDWGFRDENSMSFPLEKTTGPFSVELAVWNNLREVTVPFHYGKAAK